MAPDLSTILEICFLVCIFQEAKTGCQCTRIYLAPHLLRFFMCIVFFHVFIFVAHGGALTVHVKESLGLNVVHNCGGFTGTGAVGATSSVRSLDSRP